ncbi:DUF805 domain-containing protein [Streptomyces sp. NPDC020667]|uniref:DUF805 domain-containing protein n=1 Tax=Streptomyces sp. NPDC020667 TaxID=3154895 RepID=UPI0033E3BF8B
MHWFTDVLKKYAVFNGRARRQEYWMFTLIATVISLVLAVADALLGTNQILQFAFALALLIPTLAVSFRRLHDTHRSGWWILIGLVPLVGWIILLVFMCLDSTPHHNKYGPNPKQPTY